MIYKGLICIMLVAAFCVSFATAATVGSTLNYQGKLTDAAGNPLTGSYSVTFKLYDVASGGTALATDTHSVTASNGLFTTTIAVTNPAVVDGRALWLGITVGADAEMTPRQEIRPVPYAMSLRPGATINGTGTKPVLNVSSNAGVAVYGKSDTNTGVAGESQTGTGVYGIGREGGYFTSAQGGSGSTWIPALNVSTKYYQNPGIHVRTSGTASEGIGIFTTGNQGWGLKVSTKGTYYARGIDVNTSGQWAQGLHVETSGPASDGIYAGSSGDNSHAVIAAAFGKDSSGIIAFSNQSNGFVANTNKANHEWGVYTEDYIYAHGIRVAHSEANSNGVIASATGAGSRGVYGESTSGFGVQGSSASSTGVYGNSTSGPGIYGKSTSGAGVHGESQTGIGVKGESTDPKGTGVAGWGYYGVSGTDPTNSGFGVLGNSAGHIGVEGDTNSGIAVNAYVNGPGTGINALCTGNGTAIVAYSNEGSGIVGNSPLHVGVEGDTVSGIAVNAYVNGPGTGVKVSSGSGTGVDVGTTSGTGVKVATNGQGSRGVQIDTSGLNSQGVRIQTSSDVSDGIYARTNGANSMGIIAATYGPNSWGVNAYSGLSNAIVADTGNANHQWGVYTDDYIYAGGIRAPDVDLAEYMPVEGDPSPGTVLVIGPEGKLQIAATANDTRVAGIISTSPAIALGTKPGGNNGEEIVAISGRVPCRVDASSGAIHPGDLLSTSNTPGHAMKAMPVNIGDVEFYRDGTVLGKAMGTLESGTGTIEVLVTLQ